MSQLLVVTRDTSRYRLHASTSTSTMPDKSDVRALKMAATGVDALLAGTSGDRLGPDHRGEDNLRRWFMAEPADQRTPSQLRR